jgi:hypothetical protein
MKVRSVLTMSGIHVVHFLLGGNKMKKSIGLALIMASVFAAPSAMAQKGMWEMSVAGNVENSTNEYDTGAGTTSIDSTNTFINVDVGRYFTPKLVGRVSVGMFGSETGGTKSLGMTVGAGVKYYFGEAAKSQWVPFVNGGLNIVSLDAGGTTYSGAGVVGGGGVSYFITEEVSGDVSLQAFGNYMTGNSIDVTQTGTRLLFGLTARY